MIAVVCQSLQCEHLPQEVLVRENAVNCRHHCFCLHHSAQQHVVTDLLGCFVSLRTKTSDCGCQEAMAVFEVKGFNKRLLFLRAVIWSREVPTGVGALQ